MCFVQNKDKSRSSYLWINLPTQNIRPDWTKMDRNQRKERKKWAHLEEQRAGKGAPEAWSRAAGTPWRDPRSAPAPQRCTNLCTTRGEGGRRPGRSELELVRDGGMWRSPTDTHTHTLSSFACRQDCSWKFPLFKRVSICVPGWRILWSSLWNCF